MTENDDHDLWARYAAGVRKKDEKVAPPPQKKVEPPAVVPVRTQKERPLPAEPAPKEELLPTESKPAPEPPKPFKKEPLDLRVERNMSLGDVVIEARLDLHGRTEQEAYEAFQAFVETQYQRGKRMLLVITGKGLSGESVLRTNLPRWCMVAPFEEKVQAVRTAAQHHGGEGAYYVLLYKRHR